MPKNWKDRNWQKQISSLPYLFAVNLFILKMSCKVSSVTRTLIITVKYASKPQLTVPHKHLKRTKNISGNGLNLSTLRIIPLNPPSLCQFPPSAHYSMEIKSRTKVRELPSVCCHYALVLAATTSFPERWAMERAVAQWREETMDCHMSSPIHFIHSSIFIRAVKRYRQALIIRTRVGDRTDSEETE